jgi:hypothetical protein
MNSTLALPVGAPRRRALLATCAFAVLLSLAGAPAAFADSRLVQVDVLERDSGETLHVWRDHGRPVIAGRPGARYAVRLVNTSGERVLAVVAIDGINVVSGETASVAQRGYVLEPWQRTEITGWRKSDDEVAAFEFTALADSYAARTGRPLDVGVIGVAVFREAPALTGMTNSAPSRIAGMARSTPAPALPDAAESPSAAPQAKAAARADEAGSGLGLADTARAQAPVAPERLGTGHGARETSVVRVTTFQRASPQPDQRIEIRYDSLDNLVAAGIVPRRAVSTAPQPFPADPPRGYVPDPPRR